MDLTPYLKFMVEKEASDLFFSVGAPVTIKIQGHSMPVGKTVLQPGEVKRLAYSIADDAQQKIFEKELELNLAITLPDTGRFRVNVYRQRGEVSMVIRYIKTRIPSIEELQLPLVLKNLVLEPRGLILVVGATGSGKSTTLAAMVDYRNTNKDGHILTIEEPIEFIYSHKKSVVDQREVGLDTHSYANALKNAMREAPDVILIGEIRDRETMQHAIAYAETGHLCLSTLHANNANQAIDRIINFFPDTAHHQLLIDLSLNLRAVISQRLIPAVGGKRVPAVEVMLKSPYISDLIEKREIDLIKETIEKSRESGMQTFDQSLYDLFMQGRITEEDALNNADSRNNLALKIRLGRGSRPEGDGHGLSVDRE
ncbi:MAG: PilT/PilU family type 4a pilus ATPase [Gammaproteobacteria bacterium]|nr:PilT/PilU family type 4a pilus ATPase [Gammaproteobacteria bacterium]MDP2142395.1 PilT/PilU family type 4a pilus ATPase [Gammaproteobacteria bacterium]MDP2348636.1 PilT/PilU family type 4a pilus ATPase [Gammaproteobacteria bacterium]